MEGRKTVFCEMAFWDNFIKCRPVNDFDTEEGIEKLQTWLNTLKILWNANNWFDCDLKELKLKAETDDRFKYLWKRSVDGQCNLECDKDNFPNIDRDDIGYQTGDDVVLANALYLTKKDYKDKASLWGVINITPDNYFKNNVLFKDNGIAISKGENTDWQFLKKKAMHNLNSLIIVDNYVLKSITNKRIKDNLIPILDYILPEKLSTNLCITIFSKTNNPEHDKQLIYDAICAKKRYLKKIDIEVFNCDLVGHPDPFHDRAIISNNIWIGTGAGFDLFKLIYCHKEADKSTTISIVYPFIHGGVIDWADRAYYNLIKDAQKCLKLIDKKSKNYLLEHT